MSRELVIKVTCGAEAPERMNQGFTVAGTAAAAGVPVSLWLTGDAVWAAVSSRGVSLELPLAAPISELMTSVLELGTVTVCGQCAARRSIVEADLVAGARIAGAAVFVEEIMREGVQAIVY